MSRKAPGPVAGLHSSEQKTERDQRFERPAPARRVFFMENNLEAIGMIHAMGVFETRAATRPEAAHDRHARRGDYAAQRLLDLDFPGKQTRELLGEQDLSMAEATAIIARGIGKPDLRYEQFSYEQVQQALEQVGMTPKAAVYIEMFRAINAGHNCAGAAFAGKQHTDFV